MSNVNVTVFAPDHTVTTMSDEVADGSVDTAIAAAIAAYNGIDSDGEVPVVSYDEDFDNAVAKAVAYAESTEGRDLLVIVTDLVGNDLDAAEQLLAGLTDDFVVIVPVSNQGYDQDWASKLDDKSPAADKIDVIDVAGLADKAVAFAEVGNWLDAA